LKVATGDWIKFLGADDMLIPTCIEDNMNQVLSNGEIKVLFSKINIYRDDFKAENYIRTTPNDINKESIFYFDRTAQAQYKMLLLADRIHISPSVFLSRELINSVGGFDERFRLLEDYPLWLNLTRSGYKLYFMDKITVNYRMHSNALNHTDNDFLVNPNYFKQEQFRRIYTYPYLPINIRLSQKFSWCVLQLFKIKSINRNTRFNRVLKYILTNLLNPFKYIIALKKGLFPKAANDIYLE
jgi:alpha-1,3-rhamnosyltransferase